jgi:glycosyltransferase involved in cell wall biosynthesis
MIDCSVVLGTYNRLPLLQKTIESLVSSNIEIIINDAGSTDGTVEWLQKQNDSRFKLILSGKKSGVTRAYNECFELAKGKYITWFSDDLLAHEDSVTKMCDFMSSLRPIDMGAFYINRGDKFTIPRFRGYPCPPVACMFTETLKKYEYWNLDYPHYSQDLDINFKILRMGGRILSHKDLKVVHMPVNDELKVNNINKHRQIGGPNKFQLMAGNYGKQLNSLYPRVLVDSPALVKRFKEHYKNVDVHIEGALEFDLVIRNKSIIFPRDLPVGVKKFGVQIING